MHSAALEYTFDKFQISGWTYSAEAFRIMDTIYIIIIQSVSLNTDRFHYIIHIRLPLSSFWISIVQVFTNHLHIFIIMKIICHPMRLTEYYTV